MQYSHCSDRLLVAIVLAVALSGCGEVDELPRQEVSGTVTLDGKPLEQGVIQFQPTTPEQATAAGATIEAGAYSIARSEGPVPGKYKVTIFSSADDAPEEEMPGGLSPLRTERIPPEYNLNSTLTADVTEEGPNTFKFELKSK